MKKDYNQPVKKYFVKCALYADKLEYQYMILAINSDWALMAVSKDTDWDEIQIHKLTDVIGMATYGMRDITDDENIEFSLNYHCKPV